MNKNCLTNYFLLTLLVFTLLNCSEPVVVENPKINESPKINWEQVKNEKSDGGIFPKVKSLTDFPNTEFLPTLEHPISKGKNSIYAASLLYCWDEIKKAVGEPIFIDKKFVDLTLLNNSQSHAKVLKPNEYISFIKIEGFAVIAKAEFNKSLSFDTNLEDLHGYNLKFDNQEVQSFGLKTYSKDKLSSFSILYYQDDENFIIKLIPKDIEHEIILFKSSLDFLSTMTDQIKVIAEKIELGKREMFAEDKKWCYEFIEGDTLMIPKIKFNIEYYYTNLVDNKFVAKIGPCWIRNVSQRTAFLINQNGVEIESEAAIILSWGKKRKIDKRLKFMKFDKPFLLLMKRVDNKNPYFAMWVANAELMEKEE